jgi:hypothetical protein
LYAGHRTDYTGGVSAESPDVESPDDTRVRFELIPPPPDEEAQALYANFFQATASQLDLTMHLGWYALPALVTAPEETVAVPVQALAKVTVPLGLVPGIIQVLQSQMTNWQRAFGPDAEQTGDEPVAHERG